jgi:hypothetical protein
VDESEEIDKEDEFSSMRKISEVTGINFEACQMKLIGERNNTSQFLLKLHPQTANRDALLKEQELVL